MKFLVIIAAFGGGITRGLVGFTKYQSSRKKFGFRLSYFLIMIFVSGLIGALCVLTFDVNPTFAFIIGYAGGDFIENVYKIIIKKPSLYLPSENKER